MSECRVITYLYLVVHEWEPDEYLVLTIGTRSTNMLPLLPVESGTLANKDIPENTKKITRWAVITFQNLGICTMHSLVMSSVRMISW